MTKTLRATSRSNPISSPIYRYHPAYQQGRSAYAEGTRRSHNPYSGGDDQTACTAWWYGYDDEAEINPRTDTERAPVLNPTLPLPIPSDLAVCPICGGKLIIVDVDAWYLEEQTGLWIAETVYVECEHEPDIESDDWEDFDNGHYSMPYVDWLPIIVKIEQWFQKHYRYTK